MLFSSFLTRTRVLFIVFILICGFYGYFKKYFSLKSGIEKEHMDLTVKPQDDFFRYVNGNWLKTVEIPEDKSSWGSFMIVREGLQSQLKGLIEEISQKKSAEGTDAQKVGDFYKSFMDEEQIEKLGITPLNNLFVMVEGLKSKEEFPAFFAKMSRRGINSPIGFYISQDARQSTQYAVHLAQSGISLPDRDYYLDQKDPQMKEIRSKYQIYVEKMLQMAGDGNYQKNAETVVSLETQLAQIQWDKVTLRDSVKRYNKMGIDKLSQLAPSFSWKNYFDSLGVQGFAQEVIVGQPSFFQSLDSILVKTSLDQWKIYFRWQMIREAAPYLSKAFVEENFAFYGTVLSGIPQMTPRWKRGVSAVQGAVGEVVGKLYVERYFPPEQKARMDQMVKNLLVAYRQSLETLDWMSPETKKEALQKLEKFTTKIGYPQKWRDYSALQVRADDLWGNIERSDEVDFQFMIDKLGKPLDREEWHMLPQTVNAYYNPLMNEIVFPAAILQPPFFNSKADDAVNYGAIGAVIGHEISHGFDDQGSKYDGEGNLRNWWKEEDYKNYSAKTQRLVDQYAAFSPLKNYFINGQLTLGENIADNVGLSMAYKAYQISLRGKKSRKIDGFTGEQRLFLGFAQIWRSKHRDAQLMVQLKTGPHSPPEFRVIGTLRNQTPFYEAFGVSEGSPMFLPVEQRVSIW